MIQLKQLIFLLIVFLYAFALINFASADDELTEKVKDFIKDVEEMTKTVKKGDDMFSKLKKFVDKIAPFLQKAGTIGSIVMTVYELLEQPESPELKAIKELSSNMRNEFATLTTEMTDLIQHVECALLMNDYQKSVTDKLELIENAFGDFTKALENLDAKKIEKYREEFIHVCDIANLELILILDELKKVKEKVLSDFNDEKNSLENYKFILQKYINRRVHLNCEKGNEEKQKQLQLPQTHGHEKERMMGEKMPTCREKFSFHQKASSTAKMNKLKQKMTNVDGQQEEDGGGGINNLCSFMQQQKMGADSGEEFDVCFMQVVFDGKQQIRENLLYFLEVVNFDLVKVGMFAGIYLQMKDETDYKLGRFEEKIKQSAETMRKWSEKKLAASWPSLIQERILSMLRKKDTAELSETNYQTIAETIKNEAEKYGLPGFKYQAIVVHWHLMSRGTRNDPNIWQSLTCENAKDGSNDCISFMNDPTIEKRAFNVVLARFEDDKGDDWSECDRAGWAKILFRENAGAIENIFKKYEWNTRAQTVLDECMELLRKKAVESDHPNAIYRYALLVHDQNIDADNCAIPMGLAGGKVHEREPPNYPGQPAYAYDHYRHVESDPFSGQSETTEFKLVLLL